MMAAESLARGPARMRHSVSSRHYDFIAAAFPRCPLLQKEIMGMGQHCKLDLRAWAPDPLDLTFLSEPLTKACNIGLLIV